MTTSAATPRMTTVSQSSRKFCKCAFASSFGLPQNGLAYTMLMRHDLSSKFMSPTLMLGLVATLSVEGTENSRRVFSAIASRTSGASEIGSYAGRIARGGTTRGRALLTSLSGLSVLFFGREKPVIHYPCHLFKSKIKEDIK